MHNFEDNFYCKLFFRFQIFFYAIARVEILFFQKLKHQKQIVLLLLFFLYHHTTTTILTAIYTEDNLVCHMLRKSY